MVDATAMANVLVEASDDGGRVDRGYREKDSRNPRRRGAEKPNVIVWGDFGFRFVFPFR